MYINISGHEQQNKFFPESSMSCHYSQIKTYANFSFYIIAFLNLSFLISGDVTLGNSGLLLVQKFGQRSEFFVLLEMCGFFLENH